MKQFFFSDESITNKGKYLIRLDFDVVRKKFPTGTMGSYDILTARVLNLDYCDYLRYCRDCYGAELVGKNNKYITVYFNSKESADKLVKILNDRINKI